MRDRAAERALLRRSGSTWIHWWSPVASANGHLLLVISPSRWTSAADRPCTPSTLDASAPWPSSVDYWRLHHSGRGNGAAAGRPRRAGRRVRRHGDRQPHARLVLRPRRDLRAGRRRRAGGPGGRRGRGHGRRRRGEGRAGRGRRRRRGDPPHGRPGRRHPGRAPGAADLDRHLAGGGRAGGAGGRRRRRQRRVGRRGPRAGRRGRRGRRRDRLHARRRAAAAHAPAPGGLRRRGRRHRRAGRRRWPRPRWRRAWTATAC